MMRRPKHSFTIAAFLASVIIAAFIPFFSQITKEVPVLSLCLGQFALVFLYILAAFPRANYEHLRKLSIGYMLFIGSCFAILNFLPFAVEHKLFSIDVAEGFFSAKVAVNLVSLVFLNVASFVYLSLGFYIVASEEAPLSEPMAVPEELAQEETLNEQSLFQQELMSQAQIEYEPPVEEPIQKLPEDPFVQLHENQQIAREGKEYIEELKDQVDKLFEIYLHEEDDDELNQNQKLEVLESALLKSIDMNVEEALCIDKNGEILEDTVFNWSGSSQKQLLNVFNAHKNFCNNLKTGKLCQLLVSDGEAWFIIAKYKGNYLVLKTRSSEPSPLLDSCYKVFQSV